MKQIESESIKIILIMLLFIAITNLSCQDAWHFPRIVNLYGSGIGWTDSEHGMEYWQKLGMIIGGGANWVNNYESQELILNAQRAASMTALIKKNNPALIVLPYFDIREAPENYNLPAYFWKIDSNGQHMVAWPGTWLVDTTNPEVLSCVTKAVQTLIYPEKIWDGVFLDCWGPDKVLIPQLKKARRIN